MPPLSAPQSTLNPCDPKEKKTHTLQHPGLPASRPALISHSRCPVGYKAATGPPFPPPDSRRPALSLPAQKTPKSLQANGQPRADARRDVPRHLIEGLAMAGGYNNVLGLG